MLMCQFIHAVRSAGYTEQHERPLLSLVVPTNGPLTVLQRLFVLVEHILDSGFLVPALPRSIF